MSESTLETYGDSISSLAFDPNDSSKLLVGCWDGFVYLHRVSERQTDKLKLRGAVLDVCFGKDGAVYASGLAKETVKVDFVSAAVETVAKHDDAVKCVEFLPSLGPSAPCRPVWLMNADTESRRCRFRLMGSNAVNSIGI